MGRGQPLLLRAQLPPAPDAPAAGAAPQPMPMAAPPMPPPMPPRMPPPVPSVGQMMMSGPPTMLTPGGHPGPAAGSFLPGALSTQLPTPFSGTQEMMLAPAAAAPSAPLAQTMAADPATGPTLSPRTAALAATLAAEYSTTAVNGAAAEWSTRIEGAPTTAAIPPPPMPIIMSVSDEGLAPPTVQDDPMPPAQVAFA